MVADGAIVEEEREERELRDSYGAALLLELISVLVLIAAGGTAALVLTGAAALLQVVALMVTLRVSGVAHRLVVMVSFAAGLAYVLGAASHIAGGAVGQDVAIVLWLALAIATMGAIVRRLTSYLQVNLQLIMGLLVVYLLIGVGFGLAYRLAEAFAPGAFAPVNQGVSGATYFSFVTLATLGYGDITPVTSLARALAVAEAITGQLYLVSVVSLAVSRLGILRRGTNEKS